MELQKEIISKLAVMLESKEVLGLEIKEDKTTIKVKDLNDSYFYNNFENKYVYKGADDAKRVTNMVMDNTNGFIDGTGIHVHGFKSVADIKNEGREVSANIMANYETLKQLNKEVA